MSNYRKKPVEVQAIRAEQIVNSHGVEERLPDWVWQAFRPDPETDEGYGAVSRLREEPSLGLEVRTKQDVWISVDEDEWIVCAAPDDLWPVDAEVFEANYEPVDSAPRETFIRKADDSSLRWSETLAEFRAALATLSPSEDTTSAYEDLAPTPDHRPIGGDHSGTSLPRSGHVAGGAPTDGSGAPLPEADECAEAVRVLTRFMCCKAGERYVEKELLRPFGFTLDAGPVVRQNSRLREDAEYVEVLLREMVENLDAGDDDLARFRRRIFGTAQYLKSRLAELEPQPLPEGEKCERGPSWFAVLTEALTSDALVSQLEAELEEAHQGGCSTHEMAELALETAWKESRRALKARGEVEHG